MLNNKKNMKTFYNRINCLQNMNNIYRNYIDVTKLNIRSSITSGNSINTNIINNNNKFQIYNTDNNSNIPTVNKNHDIANKNENNNKYNLNLDFLDINDVVSFYPKNILKEESISPRTDNEESTYYSQERDLNQSFSNSSLNKYNGGRKFSSAMEAFDISDETAINTKLQEGMTKLVEHCKYLCSTNKNRCICKYINFITF